MANWPPWHQSTAGKVVVQCATLKVTFVPVTGSCSLTLDPLCRAGSRRSCRAENALDLFLTLGLVSCSNVSVFFFV